MAVENMGLGLWHLIFVSSTKIFLLGARNDFVDSVVVDFIYIYIYIYICLVEIIIEIKIL